MHLLMSIGPPAMFFVASAWEIAIRRWPRFRQHGISLGGLLQEFSDPNTLPLICLIAYMILCWCGISICLERTRSLPQANTESNFKKLLAQLLAIIWVMIGALALTVFWLWNTEQDEATVIFMLLSFFWMVFMVAMGLDGPDLGLPTASDQFNNENAWESAWAELDNLPDGGFVGLPL